MDLGRIPTDLRWGMGWGMRLASGLSVIAVAVVAVHAVAAGGEGGRPPIIGLMIIVGWYAAGGLVTGSVVGLLRPLGRSQVGGAIVGFLAALPVSIATYVVLVGLSRFSWPVAIVGVLTALVIGGVAGLIIGGGDPHVDQPS